LVPIENSATESLLIVRPNRSASWRGNKFFIIAFSLWIGLIGCVFAAIGLWPILPFAGLEISALAGAMYYVCWKLQQRHVLRFRDGGLTLEKGFYYPRLTWHFARDAVSLSVEVQSHPWDPLKIVLCSREEQIPPGNFLNNDDSRKLLSLLKEQGLNVRNYSELTRLPI
jgi:uncharacterized membrane protein